MNKRQLGQYMAAQVRVIALGQGFSQRSLARAAGLNITCVHELWNGGSPLVSVFTLGKVADALGTTIDKLAGRGGK